MKERFKKIGILVITIILVGYIIWLSKKYSDNYYIQYLIKNVWNHTIYTSNKVSVSFGKIIIAILSSVIGYISAKSLSEKIITKILKQSSIDENNKNFIQKILYYILLLSVFLIALNIAEIPLTIFTFFGGAFALGIGIGSQNIINNFISGLIVQVEKPFKINDYIEIDGIMGEVIEITARCTKLKTTHNTIIIIPNSYFLEKKLINWSKNNEIRFQINFGFDQKEENDISEKILYELKKKNPDLKMELLLIDFADNYYIYSIFGWSQEIKSNLDKIAIESNVRKQIIDIAKKNNKSIFLPKEKKDAYFYN